MALIAKVETETKIKAPADKFFKLFKSQAHHLPNICSDKIHKIEVHEGDWETQGSVKHWSYTIGGNSQSIKETVESIDEENRSMTFKVLDGEVLKEYKSYKFTAQAIPKGEGCLVIWTIEYEKASEGGPDPHNYLEFAVNITKDIESHLLNA
ncbi:MLP-like protein 43 [Vitis riparia]|uniref:MLP-like protein 43 n=1 Tax=Vitis riparia TaxID=96939 RepID=UPI00155A151E|nr:MLP-like protein 43 [Vitis riparia]